jgi:hypothetical protein
MRFIIPLIVLFSIGAQAQEHNRHPVRDLALHEKFYSTWHMPDNPTKSCCNMADCYPTEIKIIDGKIYAQRREDSKWLFVPAQKVERNRDNPDGRNHICAPPPTATSYPADSVFCFALGGGI